MLNSVNNNLYFATLVAVVVCVCIGSSDGQVQGRPGTIPKYALSNRCTSADREAIDRCEEESRSDWDVRDTDYYTPTRKFCCFAWDTLSCELRIAQRCDPNYAAKLSYLTEQSYSSFCEYHSRPRILR